MYLSRLLKTDVTDSSDQVVGRLKDVLIQNRSGKYAPLLFLLVEQKKSHHLMYIPMEYVSNLSKEEISLKNLIGTIPQTEPEGRYIYLDRDVMDEQIVDLEGARVVRVNDLRIAMFENVMCVLGIDVSFRGILRRLRLTWMDIFSVFKVQLIDWSKTRMVKGTVKLDTVSDALVELHPADLANIIEDLTVKQGSKLVDALDAKAAAQVMEEMDPAMQKMIIKYLGPERAHDIVEKMSVDETVDLLQMLPKAEAKKFLSYLQESTSKKVSNLIEYPDDTAGGLMTTEYVEAEPDWTVEQVVAEVRRLSANFRSLLYVYVTDANDTFLGAISVRNLLLAKPVDTVRMIMKVVPESSILTVGLKIKEIIEVMTKYNLFMAAVVDEKKRLVGVVTIDDVMRHLAPHA